MSRKQVLFILLISLLTFNSCNRDSDNSTTDPTNQSDTLRVVTMFGPTSYFLFREEFMGFDYEMATNLAEYAGMSLKVSIAKNEEEMLHMLRSKEVDFAAYNMVETKKLKRKFQFIFPQTESYQVLVQMMNNNALSNVTELADKEIYVKENSVFHEQLLKLNEEIGGTIQIKIAPDSLTNEDLIDMVAQNKIKYTVAYHNVAMLYKKNYKRLDTRLRLSFQQHNGWLIRKTNLKFIKLIDEWSKLPQTVVLGERLHKKYWERSPYFISKNIKIPHGAISPYDDLFKKYAPIIDWDWRLIASIAYNESKFDPYEVSWAGACGVMQLMPKTAANFGLDEETIFDAELNIEAGVQYIKSLNLTMRKVEDKDERIKFILACYNSGPAHIIDAMALAEKYGKNPYIWFGNVEYFLLKKSEPEFYQDSVVKYGPFGGNQTVRYVQNTMETYEKYIKRETIKE